MQKIILANNTGYINKCAMLFHNVCTNSGETFLKAKCLHFHIIHIPFVVPQFSELL